MALRGLMAAFLVLSAVMLSQVARAAEPVRIGLTAVVMTDNLRALGQWGEYLSEKLQRPVEFVRRRSYKEVIDLVRTGQVDFAWICGYPFVQKREPEFLGLLAVPIYKGQPLYHSLIIVQDDSPYQTLEDLKGKVFAFSDPDSNSGYLVPTALLAESGRAPDRYFRQTFFTFNHADTVEAVAARVADSGAVDSYIWDYLVANRPEIAAGTRVIHRSPAYGFPPLVYRIGTDEHLVQSLRSVLKGMDADPQGREHLDAFMLDGFQEATTDLYDGIKILAEKLDRRLTSAGRIEP